MIHTIDTAVAPADDLPGWVSAFVHVFERVGVGASVLIFLGAVIWKVIPPLTKLLRSWKSQSDRITDAVPRFEADFRTLVANVQTGFQNMERKLDASPAVPCPHFVASAGDHVRASCDSPGCGGDRDPGLSLRHHQGASRREDA